MFNLENAQGNAMEINDDERCRKNSMEIPDDYGSEGVNIPLSRDVYEQNTKLGESQKR